MNNKEVILVMIQGIETQLQTLKNLVYASEKTHSEPIKPIRQEKLEESYLSEEEERQLEQRIEKEHQELVGQQTEVEEEMARMRSLFEQADSGLLPRGVRQPQQQPSIIPQNQGPNMHQQMGDFEGFMENLGN